MYDCPTKGADMGVFQVVDAPTYGYVCTLPVFSARKKVPAEVGLGNQEN